MKLVIFIPCLNEETTLPLVLEKIPAHIKGVDEIETIIVDDGSTDKTVEVAKKYGVKNVVHHARNRGLAHSFRDGIRAALDLGADVIVMTDGDNQYPQEMIPELVAPIVAGKADVVIGDRQTQTIEHFSPFKKFLQRFGTRVLNQAANTDVPDATTGFRAWSREAAMQINLISRYTFGMETFIQAGNKRHAIETIVIKTNPKTRESRLFKSSLQHARRQALIIIRSFIMYKPGTVFLTMSAVTGVIGLIPFLNYVYVFFANHQPFGAHHLQSLLIGLVFLMASFFSFMLAIMADLIRTNRSILEDVMEELRRQHPPTDRLN
jgi:glycosyltransferase involved in cell wall biosynthesis